MSIEDKWQSVKSIDGSSIPAGRIVEKADFNDDGVMQVKTPTADNLPAAQCMITTAIIGIGPSDYGRACEATLGGLVEHDTPTPAYGDAAERRADRQKSNRETPASSAVARREVAPTSALLVQSRVNKSMKKHSIYKNQIPSQL